MPWPEVINEVAEWPLKNAQQRFEKLGTGLSWRALLQILLISLFVTIGGWLLIHVEAWITSGWNLPTWLHFIHHPISIVFGLFILPLLTLWKFIFDYRKDQEQLGKDLVTVRTIYSTLQDSSFAYDFLKGGLLACKDDVPFKLILDALSPGNSAILSKLEHMSKETVLGLELLDRLTRLPQSIRRSLCDFFDASLLEKEWGPLFMTFAIELQLDPWKQARNSERYVFIRDLEEIKCFYSDEETAIVAFRDRLERDLAAILALVNGSLWSVMFRDIAVWEEDSYYDSNKHLLERAKNGTDLRRLFLYEEAWLADPQRTETLKKTATWHEGHQYPCKYYKIMPNSNLSPLILKDPDFMASCLVNRTQITMHQHQTGPSVDRYLYRCNAEDAIVNNYQHTFLKIWEHEASEPKEFLRSIP